MTRVLLGDVVADLGPSNVEGKRKTAKVGTAFHDGNGGRIAIVLDTLPIHGSGWQGWLNIFPRRDKVGEDKDIPF